MDRLSTLDASFLEAEDADRHISLAIGGIAIVEGPVDDQGPLLQLLGERLLSLPRFTQVLRASPLDIKAPEWVPDPNFNLEHHVRRAALPAPGDDDALFTFAADVMARRLDRDRPLWECVIIEGLSANRWAILIKLHHCIADGIAATNTLMALCDGKGNADTFADQIHGSRAPLRQPGHHAPGWDPLRLAQTVREATTAAPRLAVRAATGTLQIVMGILQPSASSLTGSVGTLRRYHAVRVSLADVEQICDTFAVTVNDVALAAITESFRSVLLHRDQTPDNSAVRALVPVSTRRINAFGTPDNRVTVMLARLPVHLADPLERLQEVHRRLQTIKHSGQTDVVTLLIRVSSYIPFALSAWTVRLLTHLQQHGVVTLTTNVPGPRKRQTINGHSLAHLLPLPPIALGLLTGVAILTYADELVFGITADYDGTPDLDLLANGIADGIQSLVAASRQPPTDGDSS